LNQPLRGSVFVGWKTPSLLPGSAPGRVFFLMASLVGVGPFSIKVGGTLFFQLAWSSATPTKI